ncbi:MAG: hypothetical protein JSV97_11785 [candidate division WOR-3 bacterium]|nr:MAG: hypothetical protein JSV97_11785 [candidate division WOR-3 bacterium]
MNKDGFNSIPEDKTLSHKVVGPKVNDLIEFYVNKIDREFPFKQIKDKNWRGMSRVILLTLVYVAKNTYRSILFLCDMVSKDPARKIEYSLSAIPLLRVIMEEVFTVAFISENLEERIKQYCKAGWRETKEEYDRFLACYGKDKNWISWFNKYKEHLNETTGLFGITSAEAANPKKNILSWPTPGQMKKHVDSSVLKDFMQYLQDWYYKQFSQAVHLTYPGLAVMGSHFLPTYADKSEDIVKKLRSDCAFHSITLILAYFSEIEHILKFQHKKELKYLWTIVSEYWGIAQELYDKRYQNLLR